MKGAIARNLSHAAGSCREGRPGAEGFAGDNTLQDVSAVCADGPKGLDEAQLVASDDSNPPAFKATRMQANSTTLINAGGNVVQQHQTARNNQRISPLKEEGHGARRALHASRRRSLARHSHMGVRVVAFIATAALLVGCGGSNTPGPVPLPSPTVASGLVRISTDTFTDPLGQHETEVEPSAAVHGRAILAAFQIARQRISGGSAIGVATSFDGGSTWSSSSLPGITKINGGIADSASDASVAYDAAHAVWLISSIPVIDGIVPYPEVSRSADAVSWSEPVRIGSGDVSDDKEWIACDNWTSSPYFGHCYLTWDDAGRNGVVEMSTSKDGGATWTAPIASADSAAGVDVQAAPQPSGTVVLVSDDFNLASVFAIASHDGGKSLGTSMLVAPIIDHQQAGDLRSGALVTTTVDTAGTVYAVWQDCRFEADCAADDLVLSTTSNGQSWTQPQRLPLDPLGSGVDHFIPGIGADTSSAGRVGLAYYTYARAACAASCALSLAYTSSSDGGKTWTAPVSPGNEMFTSWFASTNEGFMVADYVASVFTAGTPVSIYTQAFGPNGNVLNEATYAWNPHVSLAQAMRRVSVDRELSRKPDHPLRHFRP